MGKEGKYLGKIDESPLCYKFLPKGETVSEAQRYHQIQQLNGEAVTNLSSKSSAFAAFDEEWTADLITTFKGAKLYLGDSRSVKDLRDKNIDAVYSCTSHDKEDIGTGIESHQHLKVEDNGDLTVTSVEKFEKDFGNAADQVYNWLKEGKNVLVHCQEGVSRSTSILMCLFIKYRDMSIPDALRVIQKCRPIANPMSQWKKHLIHYTVVQKNTCNDVQKNVQLLPKYLFHSELKKRREHRLRS